MKLRNKAFLIALQESQQGSPPLEEDLSEMAELSRSAGIQVVGSLCAKVRDPKPSLFIREGKLAEINEKAKSACANLLIFSVDLSPVQTRNIELAVKIPVLDRTGLILDIFGKRAQSREGKLQVELAQLQYKLPRIGGLGTVMSRLGGGIGTRGPGEPELEHDRRKIRNRIQRVKEELEKVKRHRELIRSGRRKRHFTSVALVGYTNAGKSSLLNALTGAEAYVADKLFATLDPKTRLQSLNGRRDVLFVDTVGFLRDLPHGLVESFHATLEEVASAEALIHVLDISQPRPWEQKAAVEEVLREIGAHDIPAVLALNKTDLVSESERKKAAETWPEGILISAREGWGRNALLAKLMSVLEQAPSA